MDTHLSPQRSPIERQPLTVVLPRVVFRLIQFNQRHNPDRYRHPPTGMAELAAELRANGFGGLYFTMLSAAKCYQLGYGLVAWRDDLSARQRDRAIHKARIPRARK
jgi:hypothetical protein